MNEAEIRARLDELQRQAVAQYGPSPLSDEQIRAFREDLEVRLTQPWEAIRKDVVVCLALGIPPLTVAQAAFLAGATAVILET